MYPVSPRLTHIVECGSDGRSHRDSPLRLGTCARDIEDLRHTEAAVAALKNEVSDRVRQTHRTSAIFCSKSTSRRSSFCGLISS
jgi:hypothetical protein